MFLVYWCIYVGCIMGKIKSNGCVCYYYYIFVIYFFICVFYILSMLFFLLIDIFLELLYKCFCWYINELDYSYVIYFCVYGEYYKYMYIVYCNI